MNVTVLDYPQRSPEWFAARLGRLTGSVAGEMLAKNKDGKWAAGRRNLRLRLVLERLTGRSMESGYQNAAMLQGIEREVDAVGVYEAMTGRVVRATGFLQVDGLMAGCSLDGDLGDFEGIVEVKCPTPAVHLGYIRTGTIPADYYAQIQHNLWVTGAEWCDWLSFNPDFPEKLQTKLVRVTRGPDTAAYGAEALAFLAEVDAELLAVQQLAEAVA